MNTIATFELTIVEDIDGIWQLTLFLSKEGVELDSEQLYGDPDLVKIQWLARQLAPALGAKYPVSEMSYAEQLLLELSCAEEIHALYPASLPESGYFAKDFMTPAVAHARQYLTRKLGRLPLHP